MNEEKKTPGVVSGKADDKGKATKPRTSRRKKSVGLTLGSYCEGAPVVGADLCGPALKAYNAAIKRADVAIARAIAEAVHASLE